MQVYNKQEGSFTIIATINDTAINEGNDIVMKIYNPFIQKSYSLRLTNNLSSYPDRYAKYTVSDPENYETGVYRYTICECLPNTLDEVQVLEIGLLQVMDAPIQSFVSILNQDTDNDFLVMPNI